MARREEMAADWRQILASGIPEAVTEMLQAVEYFRPPAAVTAIAPLLGVDEFRVRLRAVIALGRLATVSAAPPLLEVMQREKATPWRLAALDSFCQLPGEKTAALAAFLPQEQDVLFLRGVICCLGQQGPTALEFLCAFVATPGAGRIKEDLLAEAIWCAAGGERDLLAQQAARCAAFRRFARYRLWPDGLCPKYSLYPHPGYLWEVAQAHGVNQKQFQRLYFRRRRKQKQHSIPPEKEEAETGETV